jgi:hypothetical protein
MSDGPAADAEPWQAPPARRLMNYPLGSISDWAISFVEASADEVREGSTWLRDRRVVVYVQPAWLPEKAANAMAHEIGHVHDAVYLNAKTRNAYMRDRGLSWWERHVTVKWPALNKQEPRKRQRVACEDFAEVFALRWAPPVEFQGSVRPAPSGPDLSRLEPFLMPPRS